VSSQVWWYVARSSGFVAWGLLTGAVALGLWVSLRLTRNRPRPAWTLDLHRFLGGLAVVFTGVHLAGLVADSYIEFGAAELFVPFASGWKSTAVALGVVALYLLLAIEVTSLLMRRLPRRLWRGVHLSSYVLFVVATAHLVAAGTDMGHWIVQWAVLGGTAFVAFLTIARVLAGRKRPSRAVTTPRRDEGRAAPARTRPEPVAPAPR
jgi:DMSO/TMAO reductase YedYZ heme-binding membrane subunit